jgi:lipoprotein-releasing system ATP-binding protein
MDCWKRAMLELINVTKSYQWPGQAGDVSVLNGITLKIQPGKSLAIVGPSGSGKSTLLNIMGTLDKPTTGRVIFDGNDLARLSDDDLAMIRNQQIGFVFQMHHLLPQCTVLENVLIPTLAYKNKVSSETAQQQAVELLKRVELEDWASHRPGELSGGQRQRVAVVRALINEPVLLLADEPTGSLDKEAADNIADLLADLNQSEKVAMVVVTHSVKLSERMGEVMELRDGMLKNGSRR